MAWTELAVKLQKKISRVNKYPNIFYTLKYQTLPQHTKRKGKAKEQ